MSCVALAATLMVDLSLFSELLQQRGPLLWGMRFLCPDQNSCIHLWLLLLPGHLLHYGNKASTETPKFLSGNHTPSAWEAVLLLHVFFVTNDVFCCIRKHRDIPSFPAICVHSYPVGGRDYPMPSWDVCCFLFNIHPLQIPLCTLIFLSWNQRA